MIFQSICIMLRGFCDFLLVINRQPWLYLSPFRDRASYRSKNVFSLPPICSNANLVMFCLYLCMAEIWHAYVYNTAIIMCVKSFSVRHTVLSQYIRYRHFVAKSHNRQLLSLQGRPKNSFFVPKPKLCF